MVTKLTKKEKRIWVQRERKAKGREYAAMHAL